MKQAESIKQPTIAVQPFNLAKKSPQKEPSKAYQSLQKVRLRGTSQSPSPSTVTGETTRRDRARPEHRQGIPPKRMVPPPPSRPVGFAKPNPDLLNKLKQRREYAPESERSMKKNSAYQSLQKKRKEKSDSYSIDVGDDDDDDLEDEYGYGYGYDDEYDSQDDGFIVDEDEEGENMAAAAKAARRQRRDYDNMRSQGYSKDEIWEIFNRGKKRSYYDRYDDYDSDDMEATGTEILEDEERTLKQAKLDDLREQKLLEQKALQKRKITKKH
jgi:protein SPT2